MAHPPTITVPVHLDPTPLDHAITALAASREALIAARLRLTGVTTPPDAEPVQVPPGDWSRAHDVIVAAVGLANVLPGAGFVGMSTAATNAVRRLRLAVDEWELSR